jgi:hypothetical protein
MAPATPSRAAPQFRTIVPEYVKYVADQDCQRWHYSGMWQLWTRHSQHEAPSRTGHSRGVRHEILVLSARLK